MNICLILFILNTLELKKKLTIVPQQSGGARAIDPKCLDSEVAPRVETKLRPTLS